MIILHAGGSDGFIPNAELVFNARSSSGYYHDEMNHKNFMKWLREKLMPNLPGKSAIILDNASYHNVQVDRCPTKATRKADIQAWLQRHGINYSPWMLKPELLTLCKTHRRAPAYVVDDVLEKQGHRALRLPPYHPDLNAIELIWSQLKGFVALRNMKFGIQRVQGLIEEGLLSVSASDWQKCVRHVKTVEDQYWASDVAVDRIIDEFVINLESDSDGDSDSATDTASEGEI